MYQDISPCLSISCKALHSEGQYKQYGFCFYASKPLGHLRIVRNPRELFLLADIDCYNGMCSLLL